MIKQVYSRRLKKNVYRLDTRLTHGIRFRRFFLKRSDAEAVAYKIKHDATTRRFGLSVALDRPMLSDWPSDMPTTSRILASKRGRGGCLRISVTCSHLVSALMR